MTSKLKILLVEDDFLVAADISSRLQQLGYSQIMRAVSFAEAMKKVGESSPDLVLMDIEIQGPKNGIETAAAIKNQKDIPVIFLTQLSSIETYQKARITGPHAYLTKPVSDLELLQAIDLAVDRSQDESLILEKVDFRFENCIFLKRNDSYEKVLIDDILYLKAGGSYCNIHTEGYTYTLSKSMGKCMALINTYQQNHSLVQVHKGTVVNLKHVNGFKGARLLIGTDEIDVGKTYLSTLKEHIPIV